MAKQKPKISSLADAMSFKGPEEGSGLKYETYSFHGVPNLYLAVWGNGSRIFQFKMTFQFEKHFLTLGALGEITMDDAISKAKTYRQMVKDGINPKLALVERRVKTLGKFVDDIFDDFMDQHYKQPQKFRHLLTKWIVPVLGSYSLRQLNQMTVQQFMHQVQSTVSEKTGRRVSGSTAKQILSLLSKLCQCAMEYHFIDSNPCDGVRRPKVNKSRERYLLSDEYPRFMQATMDLIHRPQAKAIMILAVLGLRPSEVLGLSWSEVQLADNRIHIKDAKNGESRFVTLNSVARELFQQLYDDRKKGAVWVFPGRKTSAVCPLQSVTRTFERICDKAGITGFNLYDLRRSHATHLLQVGIDLFTIKEVLHHKTLASTLCYARVSSKAMVKANELAAERANKVIAG